MTKTRTFSTDELGLPRQSRLFARNEGDKPMRLIVELVTHPGGCSPSSSASMPVYPDRTKPHKEGTLIDATEGREPLLRSFLAVFGLIYVVC